MVTAATGILVFGVTGILVFLVMGIQVDWYTGILSSTFISTFNFSLS